MGKLSQTLRKLENFRVLEAYLPGDNSRRQTPEAYIRSSEPSPRRVLDLGCGEGDSMELFRKAIPDVEWHGVDIEDSPEVRNRTREHESMQSFDGVHLPYPDAHFDLIYCNQVLEHVRYPDQLVPEALRVLRPGGRFVAAVSYLEPYHSYSVFNFTPYGVIAVFGEAGFTVQELRPGSDASLLILRQLCNRSRNLKLLWNHNYLHGICELMGKLFRLDHQERNFLKLQFSGHLFFVAKRP